MSRKALNQPSVRQAIVTKYYGPTNTRGSRFKATCEAGSVYMPYNHALNAENNHIAAARKLSEKMGWNTDYHGALVAGILPDGSYVHVEMPRAVHVMHDALGNLLQLMAGNRGDKTGNPYSKPEVRDALAALFYVAHGRTPDTSSEALDAADPWRGTRYKVTVRSNDGIRRHHEYMTVQDGQDINEVAAQFATSYGATVESIEQQ